MKTIGIIGGMSWESSSVYYTLINRAVQARLGGVHSAKLLMYSFDFDEVAALQSNGRWAEATGWMEDKARILVACGSDFLLIACNTMHLMSDAVERAGGVTLLHIADPLGAAIRTADMRKVGLIGSRFTMDDERVLKKRLSRFGVETIVPEGRDHEEINRIVYEELVRGTLLEPSRRTCRDVIARLVERGAQGVILGCTEFPLLVRAEDSAVPLFDTTTLHANAAVELALS